MNKEQKTSIKTRPAVVPATYELIESKSGYISRLTLGALQFEHRNPYVLGLVAWVMQQRNPYLCLPGLPIDGIRFTRDLDFHEAVLPRCKLKAVSYAFEFWLALRTAFYNKRCALHWTKRPCGREYMKEALALVAPALRKQVPEGFGEVNLGAKNA